MRDPFRHPAWLLLLAPVVWLCFWHELGAGSLHTSDEAAHTDVLRNFFLRGSLTDLWYFEEPYAGKPPLKMWATAALTLLLGREEWVLRLPDAASATITTLLVWYLARRRLGGPAVLAAPLVLATAPYPMAVHGWRESVQDGALVMLMTLGAVLFLESLDARGRRGWLLSIAAGLAVGAGSLVKTVVAFLLYPPACAFLVLCRRFRDLLSARALATLGVSVACWLTWYATWLWDELYWNAVRRVTDWPTREHPPRVYLEWIYEGLHPWSLVLPLAGLVSLWRAWRGAVFDRWLVVWAAGLTAPWLLAYVKHPWYVYPAYPAYALLVGRTLFPPEAWAGSGRLRAVGRALGAVAFVLGMSRALPQAWEIVRDQEVVELHRAVDRVKALPAGRRLVVVALEPRTVCPDERYYLDLVGGRLAYVDGPAGAIPPAVTEPAAWVLLAAEDAPRFVELLAPLREVRSLGATFFWPRCRKTRSEGRLPGRVLLGVGEPGDVAVVEPLPGALTWEGFGPREQDRHGTFSWLAEATGKLWFPYGGCATLHVRLASYARDNQLALDLPGWTGTAAVTPSGVDVAIPIEVPVGGALGTVTVLGGCARPSEVEPGNEDVRCLGVSVGNLRVEARR